VTDESYNLHTLGCYEGGQVNGTTDADCNLTVAYAPSGWKATDTDCYLSDVVVTNATGTAYTLNTDYKVFEITGIIQMLNTSTTETPNNVTLIDYKYCGDSYMADSWGRSVLNVNVGLFAIAILIAAVTIVYLLFGNKKDDD
jgi:hypothetical protein